MILIDIEAEFWRAICARRAFKLDWSPLSNAVQWGVGRVEFYGAQRELYELKADGRCMAFIVPVVEAGELVDLCAIDSATNHCAQRLGLGHGLGIDAIEKGRMGDDLTLYGKPMDWLIDPVDSVYLFNLDTVQIALAGVKVIACADLALADRVAALLPPSQRDRAQVK